MMKTFTFVPGLNLRVIDREGEPWFVAKDVCEALSLETDKRGPGFYLSRLRCGRVDSHHLGGGKVGNPRVTIINESALYGLILKCRKPAAEEFQRWVTEQVLPTIRKHGAFMTPEFAQKATEDPAVFMARPRLPPLPASGWPGRIDPHSWGTPPSNRN